MTNGAIKTKLGFIGLLVAALAGCAKSNGPSAQPATSAPGSAAQSNDEPAAAATATAAAAAAEKDQVRIRKPTAVEECTRSCVRMRQMEAMAPEAIEEKCKQDCKKDPRSWPPPKPGAGQ